MALERGVDRDRIRGSCLNGPALPEDIEGDPPVGVVGRRQETIDLESVGIVALQDIVDNDLCVEFVRQYLADLESTSGTVVRVLLRPRGQASRSREGTKDAAISGRGDLDVASIRRRWW